MPAADAAGTAPDRAAHRMRQREALPITARDLALPKLLEIVHVVGEVYHMTAVRIRQ